jgi:Flp pilus assembly protein TadD
MTTQRAEDVVAAGLKQFDKGVAGVDGWAGAERTFLAALDCGELAVARTVHAALQQRFGAGSTRVRRLGAMLLEAGGDAASAGAVYADLVRADPADVASMKRQVALLRAAGDTAAAVAQLNVLLRTFPADADAWAELAELYAGALRPRLAAFCLEEVVLAVPHSYQVWARLGEAQFTAGEYLVARRCFARAVELRPDAAAKALLGVCMACAAGVKQAAKAGARETTANTDMHAWAAEKLLMLLPLLVPVIARQRLLLL